MFLQGDSKWTSPLVTLQKSDEDLICGDLNIGVNHKICSGSFPISKLLSTNQRLFFIYFAKFDLKSVYNQIQIDNKFKEIATNTPHRIIKIDENAFWSGKWQVPFFRAMENVLNDDISNMIIYKDDIFLCATTKDELKKQKKKQQNMC